MITDLGAWGKYKHVLTCTYLHFRFKELVPVHSYKLARGLCNRLLLIAFKANHLQ